MIILRSFITTLSLLSIVVSAAETVTLYQVVPDGQDASGLGPIDGGISVTPIGTGTGADGPTTTYAFYIPEGGFDVGGVNGTESVTAQPSTITGTAIIGASKAIYTVSGIVDEECNIPASEGARATCLYKFGDAPATTLVGTAMGFYTLTVDGAAGTGATTSAPGPTTSPSGALAKVRFGLDALAMIVGTIVVHMFLL